MLRSRAGAHFAIGAFGSLVLPSELKLVLQLTTGRSCFQGLRTAGAGFFRENMGRASRNATRAPSVGTVAGDHSCCQLHVGLVSYRAEKGLITVFTFTSFMFVLNATFAESRLLSNSFCRFTQLTRCLEGPQIRSWTHLSLCTAQGSICQKRALWGCFHVVPASTPKEGPYVLTSECSGIVFFSWDPWSQWNGVSRENCGCVKTCMPLMWIWVTFCQPSRLLGFSAPRSQVKRLQATIPAWAETPLGPNVRRPVCLTLRDLRLTCDAPGQK